MTTKKKPSPTLFHERRAAVMKVLPQELAVAMRGNLKKSLPYLKRMISKMESCLQKLESLPPADWENFSPDGLKFLEQEQAEIFKTMRETFTNFALAYWAYTDPHALASEAGTSLTETIMSDEYENNFCVFDVSIETKNDWLLVKTPPLPSRYKRWTPLKSHNAVDTFPLYKRELDAALSKKFAAFSEEELRKFWGYPRKNIAYIFAMSKGDSHIIDADNRDTKTTTDIICDHMLTDDGAYCTSFESFSVSDEILPVGTYIIVSPNFENPPSLSALIEAIKAVKMDQNS